MAAAACYQTACLCRAVILALRGSAKSLSLLPLRLGAAVWGLLQMAALSTQLLPSVPSYGVLASFDIVDDRQNEVILLV